MKHEVEVRDDVVEDFGTEWSRFDQSDLSHAEAKDLFDGYFAVFPWDDLPDDPVGFDLGCGSGRWARFVAPRVGTLHCIEPSAAVDVARRNLESFDNVVFHQSVVEEFPDAVSSMDFGYSLGVLHHIADTDFGLSQCVKALKPGAPFLLYLYYAMDNRPSWFRSIWKASNGVRKVVSELPDRPKHWVSEAIAATVYFPLSRFAYVAEIAGADVDNFPLSAYRHRSYYTLRTDALDRFGTRLEKRFTRDQIELMMTRAGLVDIEFSESVPFWCAVGRKAK